MTNLNSIVLTLLLAPALTNCGTEVGNGFSSTKKGDQTTTNNSQNGNEPKGATAPAESVFDEKSGITISSTDELFASLNTCFSPYVFGNASSTVNQILRNSSGTRKITIRGSSQGVSVNVASGSTVFESTAVGVSERKIQFSDNSKSPYACSNATTQNHVSVSGIGSDITVYEVHLTASSIADTLLTWYVDSSSIYSPIRKMVFSRDGSTIELLAP